MGRAGSMVVVVAILSKPINPIPAIGIVPENRCERNLLGVVTYACCRVCPTNNGIDAN